MAAMLPTGACSSYPARSRRLVRFLEGKADTHARFARVSELVDGFESPFGLELLATVHWVAAGQPGVLGLAEVTEHTYAWNDRKKQFSQRQIELAFRELSDRLVHVSQRSAGCPRGSSVPATRCGSALEDPLRFSSFP